MSDVELDEDFDDFPLGGNQLPSPLGGTPVQVAAASPVDGTGSAGKAAERQRLLDIGINVYLVEVVDEMKAMLDTSQTPGGKKQFFDALFELVCCLAACDTTTATLDTTSLWEQYAIKAEQAFQNADMKSCSSS